jgi:hypothetical protein
MIAITTYKALILVKPEPTSRAVLVKIELVGALIPSILLLTVQLISQLQADSFSSQGRLFGGPKSDDYVQS